MTRGPIRRPTGRSGIAAHALEKVGVVEGRGPDTNADLSAGRLRLRYVAFLKDIGPARTSDDDGTHGRLEEDHGHQRGDEYGDELQDDEEEHAAGEPDPEEETAPGVYPILVPFPAQGASESGSGQDQATRRAMK